MSDSQNNYRTRLLAGLDEIPAAQWDGLLPETGAPPFVRHAFLSALERTGCVGPGTGWTPCHLTLWDGATLAGAVPMYRKTHSWGEYVFDWAWADAYERNGLRYFPKLLSAVPFTPVAMPAPARHWPVPCWRRPAARGSRRCMCCSLRPTKHARWPRPVS